MDQVDKKAMRKKLYVDELQMTIIVRTILQWYFYMSAILLVVCLGAVWMNPEELAIKYVFKSFVYFSPGVIASVILLPLVIYDMLKATNRIAGPVYRLRNEMNKLSSGSRVTALKFRDGDNFQGLAGDFNVIAEQLMDARAELEELKAWKQEHDTAAV